MSIIEELDYEIRLYIEQFRGNPKRIIMNPEEYTMLKDELNVDIFDDVYNYKGIKIKVSTKTDEFYLD